MELPELNRLLSDRAESVCTELLSAGKRVGKVWIVGSILNEPGESMNVTLDGPGAGLWYDHAEGRGGDLLSLVQIAQGHPSVGPAAKWARSYLGIQDDWAAPVRLFDPLKKSFKPRGGAVWQNGSAAWAYHDEAGVVTAYAVRFDRPDGSKDIMPLRFLPEDGKTDRTEPKNWHWKGWSKPDFVPLFNLHLLARNPDRPVIVVEGEKTAQAAAKLFQDHVVVTWQGGSSRVERTDLTPLRGRNIVLWPDADAAGLKAMRFLHVALPGSRIVHLPPGLPEGWDLADPELPEFPVAGIFIAEPTPPKAKLSPLPEPATGTPPQLLYDPVRGVWWTPNSRGAWACLDRDAARLVLILSGVDSFKDESGASEVDRVLLGIQINTAIVHAGTVAGRPAGIMGSTNEVILVTTPARLLKADQGPCGRILGFIGRLLDEDDEQIWRLLLWLKFRRQAIATNTWRHGHALVLVGPADCGKSFLQSKVITNLLTGRSAKCFRYLSGKTDFNGDHFGAEHLMVDDETTKRDIDSRRSFGSNLKAMLFSENQSCHPKNRQAIPIAPIWAISSCFNDEAENLQALPPMEKSMKDKILLLRCVNSVIPLTDDRTDAWDEFESILSELPALAAYVDSLAVPAGMFDRRCGFSAYQHPALLAELDATTPEATLDELIQDVIFDGSNIVSRWQGSASELEDVLGKSDRKRDAERLISSSSRLGTYLARLAKQSPDRYEMVRTKLSRKWTIKPAV